MVQIELFSVEINYKFSNFHIGIVRHKVCSQDKISPVVKKIRSNEDSLYFMLFLNEKKVMKK